MAGRYCRQIDARESPQFWGDARAAYRGTMGNELEARAMTMAKAVIYGCGPIGCGVATYAAQRSDIELVGAVA